MRKLIKQKEYATNFHEWEKEQGENIHPNYISSDPHYKDVLVELIISQDGLCAYTEYRLVTQEVLETLKNSFNEDGRFVGELIDYGIDIEHFDSRLKTGYGWRYSNLFAVDSTRNTKTKRREESKLLKKGKSVHNIMKPDDDNYDEYRLLRYNEELNHFFANSEHLTDEETEQVEEMLSCLGMNSGQIKGFRKSYYTKLKLLQRLGDIEVDEFITGWNMMNNII